MSKDLIEKQKKEKRFCEIFIEKAKEELNQEFTFIKCEDEGKDPPDCWLEHKNLKIGFELTGLHEDVMEKRLNFCQKLADELNQMKTSPICVCPSAKAYNPKSKIPLKKTARKIKKFLEEDYDNNDVEKLYGALQNEYSHFLDTFYLAPPRKNQIKSEVVKILLNDSQEILGRLKATLGKKHKKIIKGKGSIGEAERVGLLIHFADIWKDGTFIVPDLEIFFALLQRMLDELDPGKDFWRCYVVCDGKFHLYGHRISLVQIR